MNKNICDSSKTNEVSSKMNTVKVRKASASDILTDRVPVKKQKIKSVNENSDGENVVKRQKRIIKRRLPSTSNVENQETCQSQNINMKSIRKPLTEVSNNIFFVQPSANIKKAARFSEQIMKPMSSVNIEKGSVNKIKPSSENSFQNAHLSRSFNSVKLENEKHALELKQMKDSSTKDKNRELKQKKGGAALTNEYQINKYKRSLINDEEVTGGYFCSSVIIYIDDIIGHLFLREDSMNKFTDQVKHMDHFRAIFKILANNLIIMQEYFHSFCSTVFLAAKIFEFYTSTVTVKLQRARVVMLASYWIASKYNDYGSSLTSSDLTSICSITQADLLDFEKDILSALKFNVSFPEPLMFSEYYLFHLKFSDTAIMAHCANYMIHCFLLSHRYFTYKSSKIAAAAVRLTLRYFKSMDEYCVDECWEKLHGRPAYYDASELGDVEQEIIAAVKRMQDPDFKHRQAFKKFSKTKYMSVSKKLLEIMTDSTCEYYRRSIT